MKFISSFFKYLASNFSSFQLYSIFAIYFLDNYLLLKSLSFLPYLSFCLISILNIPSNFATASFVFSKFTFFFLSIMLCYKYFLPNQVFYTSSYCFHLGSPQLPISLLHSLPLALVSLSSAFLSVLYILLPYKYLPLDASLLRTAVLA